MSAGLLTAAGKTIVVEQMPSRLHVFRRHRDSSWVPHTEGDQGPAINLFDRSCFPFPFLKLLLWGMRKSIVFACLVAPLLHAQVPNQEHHKHMHADTYAKVLEDPSRDAWQKPHEVLMALALQKTEAIADIGAGTGYFSRRFARHADTVWAVDIDPKLLEIAGKNKPDNLKLVHAKADDPSLPAASIDTIFICDVWHHIDGRPAYLQKLKQALKPGGRIVVIDFKEGKLPVGPPPSMKITEKEMVREFASAGLKVSRRHDLLPHQYFLEFR